MREDVGVVGAKLLYSDDTVQHAGVVVGFGGYAGHVNIGIRRDDYGYMVRAQINCNYSAVTAACMITKKELFEQVGGFDEQFVVACNDVDYCLKVRETGKWVVFNAFSEWYHYESKSRGYEDTPEKLKRFEGEVAKFQKKWPEILEKGDPFYNPNFPIHKDHLRLETVQIRSLVEATQKIRSVRCLTRQKRSHAMDGIIRSDISCRLTE